MAEGAGDRFRRKALRRGYKVDEVDDFLDRAESTLAGRPISEPMSAADIRDVVFRTRFGGYDEWQVDLHLDRLEKELEELASGLPPRGSNGFRALEAGPSAYQNQPPPPQQQQVREPEMPFDSRGGYRDDPYGEPPGYGDYREEPAYANGNGYRAPYEDNGYDDGYGDNGAGRYPDQRPSGGAFVDARYAEAPPYPGGYPDDRDRGDRYREGPSYGGTDPDFRAGDFRGEPADFRGEPAYRGDPASTANIPPVGRPPGAPMSGPSGIAALPPGIGGPPGVPMSGPPGEPMSGVPMSGPPGAPMSGPPGGPMSGVPMSGVPMSGPPGAPMSGPPGRPPVPPGPPTGPGRGGFDSFTDSLPPARSLGTDPYAPRHGKTDMTVELPMVGGAYISPFTNEDKVRVNEMRHAFKPRRFGSGYDPAQVDRLFDAVQATMDGRGGAQVSDSDLAPGQFGLVQGGYFEDEVDEALRELRALFSRRMG